MQDVNEETINNKIFSDKDANFQTLNMVYKIKKIKKKKTPKDTNYKNIELLDTLSNTEPNSEKKVRFDENPVNSVKTIEGFTADDYEGYDTVKDTLTNGSDDAKSTITDAINTVYDYAVSLNVFIANRIICILSRTALKKNSDGKDGAWSKNVTVDDASSANYSTNDFINDRDILYNTICLIEALLFSGLVVNNWFYLMYYNTFVKGYKLLTISRKSIEESDNFLKHFILYFFEFSIFFPEKLNYWLTDKIPHWTSKIFNSGLCYILIFISLIFIFYNSASGLKNLIIDSINVNANNAMVALMYIIVIIVFLLPKEMPPVFKLKTEDVVAMFRYNPVWNIIYNIIRFIIIIMISVPVGATMCFVYLFAYSLFGIATYAGFDKSMDELENMLKYIKESKGRIIETPCQPLSFWEKIMERINGFSDSLVNLSFFIAAIIILIYEMIQCINIKSTSVKNILLGINGSLIFIFIALSLTTKYDSVKTMFTDLFQWFNYLVLIGLVAVIITIIVSIFKLFFKT
jgi:hypothetical protein